MNISRTPASMLAMVACVFLSGAQGRAQDTDERIRFAQPVRIKAGEAFAGEGRLYPSPVLQDLDGDGRLDLVIGDLRGLVTVAPGTSSTQMTFGAEKPLLDRDGEPIDFHNW